MAEVVEAIYLSKDFDVYKNILLYLQELKIIDPRYRRIEQKDDWTDEFGKEIEEEDIAHVLNDSKIVWIVYKTTVGHVGLNIERKGDTYWFNVWFNCAGYDSDVEYERLIKRFIEIVRRNEKEFFVLCGFGKEISVEHFSKVADIIIHSLNVDVWMYPKKNDIYKELSTDIINTYEKTQVGCYDMLSKKGEEFSIIRILSYI